MNDRSILVLALAAGLLGGCGVHDGDVDRIGAVTPRAGTVVVEACSLDATQTSSLTADGNAARVFKDVILLCLAADATGAVTPAGDERAALARQIAWLRGAGFHGRLGLTLGADRDHPYDAPTARKLLADGDWRGRVAAAVATLGVDHDGIEIALPSLGDGSARLSVGAFVQAMSGAVRPARPLGLFVPPSVKIPSDLPDGDSYNVSFLAPWVDRIRVMTLDFSCCGAGPGPTIDSGWAVDAAAIAMNSGAKSLDVAVPLYGYDFGPDGETPIGFAEAHDLAIFYRADVKREASGALHFEYDDRVKGHHAVWYDDTISTVRTLEAWQPGTLSPEVGVVYYGLGAEDPALWLSLGRVAK